MLKAETIFTNKVIITGLPEADLQQFVEFIIKYAWLNAKIPASARFVKDSENPTLEKLPKTFNIKEAAERALKRGVLLLESLGPVYLGLNVHIANMKTGVNQGIKIEFDKFIFERDDRYRDLKKFIAGLIKTWEEGNAPKETPVAEATDPAIPSAKKSAVRRAKK